MNNEEMFMAILNRMDSMETGLNDRMDNLETSLNGRMDKLDSRIDKLETGLNDRMDKLEGRMDKLETGLNGMMDKLEDKMNKLKSDMDLEFYGVKAEVNVAYKSSKEQFEVLNNKFDNFMYTKDVAGYDKINIRFEVLERAYQELKEKVI